MVTITINSGFTGEVLGIAFQDGHAEVNPETHRRALAYFRQADGYTVDDGLPITATVELVFEPGEQLPPFGLADQVPDGTTQQVIDWVEVDADRARAALAVERAKLSPRTTLIASLERLLETGE